MKAYGGYVMGYLFPAQCGQGATWNKQLISRIAEVEASEADALGYTNIYSPILDISQNPRWGRCVETYGGGAIGGANDHDASKTQSGRIVGSHCFLGDLTFS